MSERSPYGGQSPTPSPHVDRPRLDSLHRSIPPQLVPGNRTASLSPSQKRPFERRNGHRGRSRDRSISPDWGHSRIHSRIREPRRSRDRSYTRSPSLRGSPQKSSKIVVEKLTKNVTENHLHEIFGSFGEIQSVDLPMNRAFMTNRGTAYILYYDVVDAEAAISHMHEAQLDGAVLKVSVVLPRRTFSMSPPPTRRAGIESAHPGHERAFLGTGRQPSDTFRASPPRRRPPTRHGTSRALDRHDLYRPRSFSRSKSPRRSRSYSARSISGSPLRKRGSPRRDSPRRRRRRSPSYSSYSPLDSYSSRSERSRSPSRSRIHRVGVGKR